MAKALRGDLLIDLWRDRILGFEKSGLSERVYCQKTGIGYSTFKKWGRRLNLEGHSLSSHRMENLIPVSISGEPPRIEVKLREGDELCFQGVWDWSEVFNSLQILLKR